MKKLSEFALPWLPFAYAVYLCYSALSHIAPSEMKPWEPAYYSFLPMTFFFVGVAVYYMQRQIRELRGTIAKLQAHGPDGNVAI